MINVIIESSNCIMPFDIRNPGRYGEEYSTEVPSNRNYSNHDYQKFEKGRDSHIEYMTAHEYLNRCVKDIFNSSWEAGVTNAVDRNKINDYAKDMKNGDIFPIPYLDYVSHQQEGRHRMMAFDKVNKSIENSDAKAPVLIITPSDPSDNEIKEYAISKFGKEEEQWGIDYINAQLGRNNESEEDVIDIDDNDLNNAFISDIEDGDIEDHEDEFEILSKKTGIPVEELIAKISNMDTIQLIKFLDKYE